VIIDPVLTDFGYLVLLLIRSPRALAAETLFLRSENDRTRHGREQLACFRNAGSHPIEPTTPPVG
jgi:hypothetical protein